jgi:antitoxin PrlF
MKQEATVTEKGQVTIPKLIRDKLGLKKGTKVYFELRGKEAVMLPEVEDPLEELRQMRKEIQFSEKEIQLMIKDQV